MNISGLGTDIVSVPRIASMLERHGSRFMNRCFRPGEIEYANGRGLGKAAAFAGRWAAKEAFLKALGRSVGHIPYGDIEVIRSAEGPVSIRLHGRAAVAFESMGPGECLLSISHEKDYAIATVLIQSGTNP